MAAISPVLSSASPILRRLATIVGWLCVIATLALLSPGVVATARADESSPPASGPTCKAPEQAAEESMVSLSSAVERIRTRGLAQKSDASDEYVVLNGRGYNYGPQPNPLEPESDPR